MRNRFARAFRVGGGIDEIRRALRVQAEEEEREGQQYQQVAIEWGPAPSWGRRLDEPIEDSTSFVRRQPELEVEPQNVPGAVLTSMRAMLAMPSSRAARP